MIESVNQPIAIAPSIRVSITSHAITYESHSPRTRGLRPRLVFGSISVGIACHVHPVPAPTFTIMGRGEKAVDDFGIRVRRGIFPEGLDFLRSRRQADQVVGG